MNDVRGLVRLEVCLGIKCSRDCCIDSVTDNDVNEKKVIQQIIASGSYTLAKVPGT